MRDWQRYERATMLRREGKTWREVGVELGISPNRASQMRAVFICRVATGHIPDVELTEAELSQVQKFRDQGYLGEPAVAGDKYVWDGMKELPTCVVNSFRRALFDEGRVKNWAETAAYVAKLSALDLLGFYCFGNVSLRHVERWLASKEMKLQPHVPKKPQRFAWQVTFVVDPKARRVSSTFHAKSAHSALKQAVLILELLPTDQLVSAEITGPMAISKPEPKGVVPHATPANQESGAPRGL